MTAPATADTTATGIFSLAGKHALVTGASSGLGEHFAVALVQAGAQVWLGARRLDRLEALCLKLRAAGHTATPVALDVTDSSSVRAAFNQIEQLCGAADIVINNAGIGTGALALSQGESEWDDVIDTNLKGSWLGATEGARRLVSVGRPGSIVNIASILGERVSAAAAAYCASKAGLIHLTRALALEWARYGIRVNALAPGYVETDLNRDFLASEAGQRMRARIPQRRFGDAADLTGPLLLLAGDAGRYMTGSVLTVDGGHLVSSL